MNRRQQFKQLATQMQADDAKESNCRSYWRAVFSILEHELWQEGGFRSAWQFLHQQTSIVPRRAKWLAQLARVTDPWPYRNESYLRLKSLGKLARSCATKGTEFPREIPDGRRTAAFEELETLPPRRIRRIARVLDRSEEQVREGEVTVLLHGLGRSRRSMNKVESALHRVGLPYTFAWDYDSTRKQIEQLADELGEHIETKVLKNKAVRCVHFVTHSMGGIVLRQLLSEFDFPVGRVVMLAPPNHGSGVVDGLINIPMVGSVMGPGFLQLRTGDDGPVRLGPVKGSVAVIAGSRPQLFFSSFLIGPNDGKVTVESAKLEGMEAFLVLDVNHTKMLSDEDVISATCNYLRHGVLEARDNDAVKTIEVGRFHALE